MSNPEDIGNQQLANFDNFNDDIELTSVRHDGNVSIGWYQNSYDDREFGRFKNDLKFDRNKCLLRDGFVTQLWLLFWLGDTAVLIACPQVMSF